MFQTLKRRWKQVVGALVLAMLLIPVPVSCGAPRKTCRTGPGPDGKSYIFYEVEPLGILLLELAFDTDIGLYYTRGEGE